MYGKNLQDGSILYGRIMINVGKMKYMQTTNRLQDNQASIMLTIVVNSVE